MKRWTWRNWKIAFNLVLFTLIYWPFADKDSFRLRSSFTSITVHFNIQYEPVGIDLMRWLLRQLFTHTDYHTPCDEHFTIFPNWNVLFISCNCPLNFFQGKPKISWASQGWLIYTLILKAFYLPMLKLVPTYWWGLYNFRQN